MKLQGFALDKYWTNGYFAVEYAPFMAERT
jgi:hypothetical protein